nr:electron transport complex subunit RsxC [Shewanella jiangmenensis]
MTLLEQLDKGTLWKIPGGIHPPEMKSLSNASSIARLPLFDEYLLPLPQVGEQASLAVSVGEQVLKGQSLTRGAGHSYLPVHAPTSGTVIAIEPRPSNHASALPVLTLVLKSDGKDDWCTLEGANSDGANTKSVSSEGVNAEKVDIASLSRELILSRIQQAGIAGMGGAAFPSHIKLSPASEIELVIVNGVECEPYITADDRLMREHADDIIAGLEIIHKLLAPKRLIIAIEDNKPAAAEAMGAALNRSHLPAGTARVTQIPTKYPSGGEKQLIQIITGKEVPSGAIPAQLGIVVHNVGTLFAIRDAVVFGKPLIERVVTVTGNTVSKPGNYWVPIGTRVTDVLTYCDFQSEPSQKIIMGGPMMGYALPESKVPILKGSNCILVPASDEIGEMPAEKPCIRCGECAVACPASLLPQQLFWHAKAEEYDKAESYNLKDCIECGCCSYVCPSDIPLVEYYRVAKAAIRHDAEEKRKAERAKVRFEARIARLEEEKNAREAKAREAAEKRKASMVGNEKDAIAAALARVQAKKAAKDDGAVSGVAADGAGAGASVGLSAAVSAGVNNTAATPADAATTAADPKAGVAAAIARAKAKKAAAQAEAGESSAQDQASTDMAAERSTEARADVNPEPSAAQDPKKAAIAAAVARAKAKKAAAQGLSSASDAQTSDAPAIDQAIETGAEDSASNNSDENNANAAATVTPEGKEDPKKAAIAAAVARAKAKKAAKAAQNDGVDAPAADTQDNADAAEKNVTDIAESAGTDGAESAGTDAKASETLTPADAKKAAVAAAVAKAKAKKAAQAQAQASNLQQAEDNEHSSSQRDAQLAQSDNAAEAADVSEIADIDVSNVSNVPDAADGAVAENAAPQADQAQDAEQDSKKARIATAVAKAKAKKAAREQE